MAMRMLKNGAFSYEQISEVTLLSVEELKTLEEKEI